MYAANSTEKKTGPTVILSTYRIDTFCKVGVIEHIINGTEVRLYSLNCFFEGRSLLESILNVFTL